MTRRDVKLDMVPTGRCKAFWGEERMGDTCALDEGHGGSHYCPSGGGFGWPQEQDGPPTMDDARLNEALRSTEAFHAELIRLAESEMAKDAARGAPGLSEETRIASMRYAILRRIER